MNPMDSRFAHLLGSKHFAARLIVVVAASLACTAARAETATQNWLQRYNGPGNKADYAAAVALDPAGNVIVTGTSYSGSLNPEMYTAKYAAGDGHLLWERRNVDAASGLFVRVDNAGDVVICGTSGSTDLYTVKYAGGDGHTIWEKTYAGAAGLNDEPAGMLLDRNGDIVVLARTADRFELVGFRRDIFDFYTVKYAASDGHVVWEKRYNSAADGMDYARDLALDGRGDVIVVGDSDLSATQTSAHVIKYDGRDGQILWQKDYFATDGNRATRPYHIALDSSGNFALSGEMLATASSDPMGYGAKFAGSNGALLWEVRPGFVVPADSRPDVAFDGLGDVFISMNKYVPNQPAVNYTAKYSAEAGQLRWEKTSSRGAGSWPDLRVDSYGNPVLTFGGFDASQFIGLYTVKYRAADGATVWEQFYEGPTAGSDIPAAEPSALGRDGSVVVVGYSDTGRSGINDPYDYVTIKYEVTDREGGEENGQLAPTNFTVNGSSSYTPPATALAKGETQTAKAAKTDNGRLDFTAIQTSRIPGLIVQVQYSTIPQDPDSWRALENGNQGRLTRDPETNAFILDATVFPQRNGVYFRAYVEAPGYPSDFSNVVGPWDLADTPATLPPTIFRIFGDDTPDDVIPGMPLKFAARQDSQATGLKVRVQYSSAPRQEATWSDLEDGTLAFVNDDFAGDHYLLESNKYPSGRGIYFRVISSAPGFTDSISNIIGPWSLLRNEVPAVQINLAEGQSFSRKGRVPVPYSASDPDDGVGRVELFANGELVDVGSFSSGEFNLQGSSAGDYSLVAVVYDIRGAIAFSNVIERITLTDEAATIYRRVNDGAWDDAGAWEPQAVPGAGDYVNIPAGRSVSLGRDVQVRFIALFGNLSGPGSLEVNLAMAWFSGHMEGLQLDIIRGAGLALSGPVAKTQKDVTINNAGKFVVSGKGLQSDTGTVLNNSGVFTFAAQRAEAFKGGVPGASFQVLNQTGGIVNAAGGHLLAPHFTLTAGQLNIGGRLIGTDGATLIGTDGATLIGTDGATLLPGGTLIGTDGATLIGTDGATLIGTDGGSLQALNGAGIVTDNGAGLIGTDGASLIGTDGATFTANGGVVTGFGMLNYASVVNNGAVMHPGRSPGGIGITGNYTHGAAASLVLEIEGDDGFAGEYDVLAINGAANLAGDLIVRSDNKYRSEGSGVVPLGYGSVTGQFDTITSNAQIQLNPKGALVTVTGENPPAPKALNIATRMRVETGDNVLIAGFIITGDAPKKVLVRGIGPSLPVAGALADPTLDLDSGAFFNDDWKSDQEQAIRDTTVPPLSELESAIVATLDPGAHTAVLRGKADGTGVGLVEVYDLESGTPAQLANISTRGQVQTGDNVMIGGFIIGGDYPAKVLIRAIGPSLPVDGALADPTLELVNSNGATISNDDWRETQEAEIVATTVPPTNDREAAIVATLVPGAYTAIVRGKDDTTGVALVEGYNLE